jgi:hypothetical protein
MDSRIAANRRLWNEWARINQESDFYDMAGFRAGQTSLKHIELEEVGDVAGKSLLHHSAISGRTPCPGRGWERV